MKKKKQTTTTKKNTRKKKKNGCSPEKGAWLETSMLCREARDTVYESDEK